MRHLRRKHISEGLWRHHRRRHRYYMRRHSKTLPKRPVYGGRYHSAHHGGIFVGGRGSSHRGGRYRNRSSGNRYGIHKLTHRRTYRRFARR